VKTKVVDGLPSFPKKPEDLMGGKDAWKDAPTTQAACPKCANKQAYFVEQQTRGGDEASTTFYQCTECKQTWREQ
jgi:DNA-directed RNA polymerase III subunit RPC11